MNIWIHSCRDRCLWLPKARVHGWFTKSFILEVKWLHSSVMVCSHLRMREAIRLFNVGVDVVRKDPSIDLSQYKGEKNNE